MLIVVFPVVFVVVLTVVSSSAPSAAARAGCSGHAGVSMGFDDRAAVNSSVRADESSEQTGEIWWGESGVGSGLGDR